MATIGNVSLLQLWPSVCRPGYGALYEQGYTMLCRTVAMADEDVLAVEIVGGAMSCCLPLFLVSFKEECASSIGHVLAFAVEVWAFYTLAASDGYAIVALGSAAAVVP